MILTMNVTANLQRCLDGTWWHQMHKCCPTSIAKGCQSKKINEASSSSSGFWSRKTVRTSRELTRRGTEFRECKATCPARDAFSKLLIITWRDWPGFMDTEIARSVQRSWEPIQQCKGFCADPQGFPPPFLVFLQSWATTLDSTGIRWKFSVWSFNSISSAPFRNSWPSEAFLIPLPIPGQLASSVLPWFPMTLWWLHQYPSPPQMVIALDLSKKSKVHRSRLWDSNT